MADLRAAATKEDIESVARRLTTAFADGSARSRLDGRIKDKGMLFAPQLLAEVESIQRELFAEWGYEPNGTLQNLQQAVRKHPETRPRIVELCDAEEGMINAVQAELAKAHGVELPEMGHGGHGHSHGGHGHSHGGHGHSHGGHGHSHGGHGHSHGGHGHSHGGHGHSHGGMDAPPGAIIAHQISMQLVQRSFAPAQMQFMETLRAKIMSGGTPTGEEQLQAMQVQQNMMKKLSNMKPLVEQAMETLGDDERAPLLAVEEKMKRGEPPTEQERQALEAAKDTVATYIATMGPMLAAMRQQQQQQQQQQQPSSGATGGEPSAEPKAAPEADKKKD